MRRAGRFLLGGLIGLGLGYALILLFHPLALRPGKSGERRPRSRPVKSPPGT